MNLAPPEQGVRKSVRKGDYLQVLFCCPNDHFTLEYVSGLFFISLISLISAKKKGLQTVSGLEVSPSQLLTFHRESCPTTAYETKRTLAGLLPS